MRAPIYIDHSGTWGSASGSCLVILETDHWSAEDSYVVDEMTDGQRWSFALHVRNQEGLGQVPMTPSEYMKGAPQ